MRRRLPEVDRAARREVAGAVARMREQDLLKPPGVAESLDWAAAPRRARAPGTLDPDRAAATLGAV